MSALLRLYPKAWRDRYGDELAALLDEHPATLLNRLDLIRGAVDARLHPQVPGHDVAPEQEIPMDRKLLGALAAIGGIVWLVGIASMFVLPLDSDGYRQATLAFLAFAAATVLIGIAIGLLGTRPDSARSRSDRLHRRRDQPRPGRRGAHALADLRGRDLRVPDHGDTGCRSGSSNGVLPGWLVLAFFLGVIGIAAGSTGGVQTDVGLALFSLVGVAGLLLAGVAFTNHAEPRLIRPA